MHTDHIDDHKCALIGKKHIIVPNDHVSSPPGVMLEECRTILTIIWLNLNVALVGVEITSR